MFEFFEITPGEYINLRLVSKITIKKNVVLFDMGSEGFRQLTLSDQQIEDLKKVLGKSVEGSITNVYSSMISQLFGGNAMASDLGTEMTEMGDGHPDSFVPDVPPVEDKPKSKKKKDDGV